MNKLLITFLFLISFSGFSQDIFGKWTTIDDKTNEEKSIVTIYEKNDQVFGKVVEIFEEKDKNNKCTECKGEDYNKPIVGLIIIKNMEKRGDYYKEGTIVDPENGNIYKLKLFLDEEDKDTLVVRGYLGFFYQTQYWKRVIE